MPSPALLLQASMPAPAASWSRLCPAGSSAGSCKRPSSSQRLQSVGKRYPRRFRGLGRLLVAAAASNGASGQADPHAVLQVPRGSSRRAIRAAYIERIKLLHPDVSADGEDTTAQAAAVNAAYEQLMAGFATNSRDDDSEEEEADPLEVFDLPEAEPDQLFVNPFACYGVSPLQWEDLQEVGRQAEAAGRDPWAALQQAGVRCDESAIAYLSPRQLALICEELGRGCAAMDSTALEIAAFYVADCLSRARIANSRVPAGAGRWG